VRAENIYRKIIISFSSFEAKREFRKEFFLRFTLHKKKKLFFFRCVQRSKRKRESEQGSEKKEKRRKYRAAREINVYFCCVN
jgi:hypothetical protein